MMYRLILLLVFTLTLIHCRPKKSFVKETLESKEAIEAVGLRNSLTEKSCDCRSAEAYIPYRYNRLFDREKTIMINLHFMNSSDKSQNHHGENAVSYAKHLVSNANERLKNNIKMNLPVGNDTEVYDPMIRMEIDEDPSTSSGLAIYDHFDDELYYFINKGKNKNNYSREVIKKYAINDDHVLNIFLLPHHPDSLASDRYRGGIAGVALGTSVKLGGSNEHAPHDAWKMGTNLNHELGHVLGLSHSWVRNDGCDDTPSHPNCWDNTGPPPCDGTVSNNLMDYNNVQAAMTPCQVGKMRSNLYRNNTKGRKVSLIDYCDYDPERSWYVRDSFVLDRSIDMEGDIIVEADAYLKICCRVHMPKKGKIIVHPGATLELYNAQLHNDCDEKWDGIELRSDGKKEGQIIVRNNTRIDNLTDEASE